MLSLCYIVAVYCNTATALKTWLTIFQSIRSGRDLIHTLNTEASHIFSDLNSR